MESATLDNKFARIGARLKVADRPRRSSNASVISLDVQTDREGEFFEIAPVPGVDATVEVLDVQPADRHLLLLVREGKDKSKYLCGHDARHWFVAGIPREGSGRHQVQGPQPPQERRLRPPGGLVLIPALGLAVDNKLVLQNEPLTRGNGGKPHWTEFCYRVGGETVYVSRQHPNGLREQAYRKLVQENPEAKNWSWQTMRRNPTVYVRGHVRHPTTRPSCCTAGTGS